MTEVNNIYGANYLNSLSDTELAKLQTLANQFDQQVKQLAERYASGEYKNLESMLTDLPDLPASLTPLSLETLLSALDDEERRNQVRSAVEGLDSKSKQIKEEGQKKIEQIQKQIEANKKAKKWGVFAKIFKAIGMVVGAIAAAATIALGVLTANPLLIAAGACAAFATIDSIVSMASDGKASFASLVSTVLKACGVSEKTANIIGTVASTAVVLAGVFLSFGAAGVASSAKISEQVTTAFLKILARGTTISNIVGGVAGVGVGVTQIGTSVASYKAQKAEAVKVNIDAILERMRASVKMYNEFIEQQMETAENLMEDTKQIIDGCAETNTAILTGSPSMA